MSVSQIKSSDNAKILKQVQLKFRGTQPRGLPAQSRLPFCPHPGVRSPRPLIRGFRGSVEGEWGRCNKQIDINTPVSGSVTQNHCHTCDLPNMVTDRENKLFFQDCCRSLSPWWGHYLKLHATCVHLRWRNSPTCECACENEMSAGRHGLGVAGEHISRARKPKHESHPCKSQLTCLMRKPKHWASQLPALSQAPVQTTL